MYEALFVLGDFCRPRGPTLQQPAFLKQVVCRLRIADPVKRYHLISAFTACGCLLFRGGP